jgi:O-antigen ligase
MRSLLTSKNLFAAHGAVAGSLLIALVVAISVSPDLVPLLLTSSLVVLVFKHARSKGTRSFPPITSPLFWCLPIYALYLIGLMWSTDMGYAWFDLGIKAGMGIVPLVAWLIPRERRAGGSDLLGWFVAGNVLAVVICCAVAIGRSVFERFSGGPVYGPANFIASRFSLFLHPSYFAVQCCFALVIAVFDRGHLGSRKSRAITVALLLIGILLSASKMGWAALVIVFVSLLATRWKDPKERRTLLLSGGVMLALFMLLVATSDYMREKVDQLIDVGSGERPSPDATGSSEVRELVWHAGGQLLREHWAFGTGTGDVKNELLARYAELGYSHPLKERLNAHSQLLQTPLTVGIIGGLMLALLILLPLWYAIRHRDPMTALFVTMLAMNWAVESMLEVQAGVVFLVCGGFMLLLRTPREPLPAVMA